MKELILPATLFSLSFVVWVFVAILGKKTILKVVSVGCSVAAAVSIIILLQREYVALAGIGVCLIFLIAIIYFGLNMPFSFNSKKNDSPLARFIDCQGIALTCLEPKGDVEINGEKIVATTEGLFVPQGEKVKVVRCSAKLVVVEKISEE